ncbi:MAG TPA: hypothetical protein PK156_16615 [Polyangium sp.]|nr:hypothetical protein [Polyangium sp.]
MVDTLGERLRERHWFAVFWDIIEKRFVSSVAWAVLGGLPTSSMGQP